MRFLFKIGDPVIPCDFCNVSFFLCVDRREQGHLHHPLTAFGIGIMKG